MKLLLLSNSTLPGEPYLGWPKDLIHKFLGEIKDVLFIPFAAVGFTYDKYEEMVSTALKEKGIQVTSIHHFENKIEAINNAQAIFVGGGNSFKLLHDFYDLELIEPIQNAVRRGTLYAGWSAGANMACPTIKTTNDMPIIEPKSFKSFGFIDFQINPHYTEKTIVGHGGETRLQRLTEFTAINKSAVICLPEGYGIWAENDELELIGPDPVKVLNSSSEYIKPGKFKA